MAAWTEGISGVHSSTWEQLNSHCYDSEYMTLTKKDLDESSELVNKLMPVANFLARMTQPFARLGFVKRFISQTTANRIGQIGRYSEIGEHVLAADLAIELLNENRHQAEGRRPISGHDHWWFFMDRAIRSLEHFDDQKKWDEVIELGRNGREPFQGYFVARSFLAFSRRTHETGDYASAVEFAEIASRADETWAEPDYILGWYYLVLGGGDPIKHLTQAVIKDPGILFRIAKDSECRKHPHIIQKLKDLTAEQISG